ncbi:hypothetical protein QK289_15535 [Exiguobacterium antarcticum]|uniref:Prepilin type IV endopeptidase peptidase domain-containing protein n=1 Tax=Exiguobacterium antarcticum TaxID=132920 RepID=A0ABT6R6M9_9BACL|nr:hypothetical protein [Exiguobacterium antarcticum]
MPTEHLFLFLFLVYMTVNVYDDLKSHTTKNAYHYPMAAILLITSGFMGYGISTFLIGIYALVFFILFSNIPIIQFGAGDIKMLVNVYMILNLFSPFDTVTLFSVISVVYFFVSYSFEFLVRLKKRKLKGAHVHAEAPAIFTTFVLITFLITR